MDKQLLLSLSNLNSSSSGESIFQHEHLQFLFLFIRKLLHVVRSQSELCYSFLFSQFLPFFSFQASAKEKKTQGDASHQTRSSSAAISWMGLGERDQVFPWFTLFPLLTLKPEGLNIYQISLVYCCSQVSSCRT